MSIVFGTKFCTPYHASESAAGAVSPIRTDHSLHVIMKKAIKIAGKKSHWIPMLHVVKRSVK